MLGDFCDGSFFCKVSSFEFKDLTIEAIRKPRRKRGELEIVSHEYRDNQYHCSSKLIWNW
jgi:hypothetical protein